MSVSSEEGIETS